MINVGNVYIDVEINGQRLTEEFVKRIGLEIFAFKIALTAGFAVPTIRMIMGASDDKFFRKFNESNTATAYVGTDPNHMDVFEWEIVGRNLKEGPQDVRYILDTGGVIIKGNLGSSFLKGLRDGYYNDNALGALTKAWKEEIRTSVDSNIRETHDIKRIYKMNNRTLQEYMVDMFTHIDIRPSFPLVTIDKNCNLVLRDFQLLKSQGPKHKFTYARTQMPDGYIPYTGKPETVSYKTYVNRFCGYKQMTGFNTDSGELSTIATSIINTSEGWKNNSLAITLANENNPIEHKSLDLQTVNVSSYTPDNYWQTAIHNKDNLVNMSAIQTKLLVQGRYLPDLKVLDLVQLEMTRAEDKAAGLYIVEALEIGFTQGNPFTEVVWLCRDNYNDIENSRSKQSKLLNINGINIPPSTKAAIVNATRNSRRALLHAQNILDKTYVREFERHLITLRTAATTNFWIFGTSVDINNNIARATSLRNVGNILANKMIDRFIAPPMSRTFYNLLTQSATMQNLFMSVLSAVLGTELYGGFYQLFSDLIVFDNFLDSYTKTLSKSSGRTAISDSGKTQAESGIRPNLLSFTESVNGDIIYSTNLSSNSITGGVMTLTSEEKKQIVVDIVDEIKLNIPDAVDIPIVDIELSDSDAIKPRPEIKDIIVDNIVDDLIDKGYVYDADIVNTAIESGTTVYIMKPDGTTITGQEARDTMLSSDRLKEILLGNVPFDTVSAQKVKRTVGTDLKIRHWGTFVSEDDLLPHIITAGFEDKYRTVNATKRMSVREGRRIFVALPSSEKKVKFYINSERVAMNEMEVSDLGYFTKNNKPIPYTIYFTNEGYNSNNVTVELRKGE